MRVRNAKGDMVYCLPPELGMPTAKALLNNRFGRGTQWCDDYYPHDSRGRSSLVLLDSLSRSDGVLGTIAGDDTIFIALSYVDQIDDIRQRIEDLFDTV